MSWVKVAAVNEVPMGGMKQVVVEEDDIAIYHAEDGFYATSDVCTHASESLCQGSLSGHVVACPRHGGKFDIRTGAAVAFPCVMPVRKYDVQVRGSDVWLDYD